MGKFKIGDRVRLLPPLDGGHEDHWTGECGVIVGTDYYDAPLYGVLLDNIALRNEITENYAWYVYGDELEAEVRDE